MQHLGSEYPGQQQVRTLFGYVNRGDRWPLHASGTNVDLIVDGDFVTLVAPMQFCGSEYRYHIQWIQNVVRV
jgi:hypothetical protein